MLPMETSVTFIGACANDIIRRNNSVFFFYKGKEWGHVRMPVKIRFLKKKNEKKNVWESLKQMKPKMTEIVIARYQNFGWPELWKPLKNKFQ